MRTEILLVSVLLVAGCGSTRIIDATWDDPVIMERVATLGVSGRAGVKLQGSNHTRNGPFMPAEDGISLLGENAYTVERSQVSEVKHVISKRRGRAFLSGAVIGGIVLGLGSAVLIRDSDTTVECDPETSFEAFACLAGQAQVDAVADAAPFVLGGVGALAGGVIGALIGSPRVEVYRFRPDTPDQMSVVIGVGPKSDYGQR